MQYARRTDLISKGLCKLACIFTLAVTSALHCNSWRGHTVTGSKLVGSPLGRLRPVEIFVTRLHTAKAPTVR